MRTLKESLAWANGEWKKDPSAKRKANGLGIDTDGYYGFQCKDLVNAYSRWHGAQFTAGNAEALWRVKQPSYWKRVKTPQPGDVHVMWFSSGGVEYGHTGLVVSTQQKGKYFRSLDQNWYNPSLTIGSPPKMVTHPTSSARGFLRPKFKGGDMPAKATRKDVKNLTQALFWRNPKSNEYKNWVNKKTPQEILNFYVNHPKKAGEHLNRRKWYKTRVETLRDIQKNPPVSESEEQTTKKVYRKLGKLFNRIGGSNE